MDSSEKSPKRILILATVGGFLQKFELADVQILQEMGWEVHYAADPDNPVYRDRFPGGGEASETLSGVRFHPVSIDKSPYHFRVNRKACREILGIIREEKISAIHCHTPVGGLLGRLAGRKTEIPVIYTAHGFHFYEGAPAADQFIYKTAEKWLAHFTDALVVINHEDERAARQFRLRPGGAVYRIPGVGLDREKFRAFSEEEKQAARRELGIGEEEYFLLSAGELNENKNQETVLRALQMLQGSLNFRYGLCGEGPQREHLEKLAGELGLEERVSFYGYCSPVQPYLAAADAFLFPSRREGLGMAALEALACGIPVIAADSRGTREYMKDGENGFVCRWDDAQGFAEAVRKAAGLSPEEREEMRRECRASTEPFAKEHTEEIMRDVYREHLPEY